MVFRGKFDGILVKPCFEQSTIAPSLAQVHWFGQEAFTKTDPDMIKIRITEILQPSFGFMVEAGIHCIIIFHCFKTHDIGTNHWFVFTRFCFRHTVEIQFVADCKLNWEHTETESLSSGGWSRILSITDCGAQLNSATARGFSKSPTGVDATRPRHELRRRAMRRSVWLSAELSYVVGQTKAPQSFLMYTGRVTTKKRELTRFYV